MTLKIFIPATRSTFIYASPKTNKKYTRKMITPNGSPSLLEPNRTGTFDPITCKLCRGMTRYAIVTRATRAADVHPTVCWLFLAESRPLADSEVKCWIRRA